MVSIVKSSYVSNKTIVPVHAYTPVVLSKTNRGFLDTIVKPILDGIVKVVVNPFLAAVKPILQTFMKFITDALSWLFPEMPMAVQGLVKIVQKVGELGVNLFITVLAVVEAVVALALSLPFMVVDSAMEFGLAVAESFKTIGDDIVNAYKDIGNKCKEIGRTIKSLDQIPDTFRNYNIGSAFLGLVSTIWTIIKSVAMFPFKIFVSVCRQFGQTSEKIEGTLDLATDNMIEGVEQNTDTDTNNAAEGLRNSSESTMNIVTKQYQQHNNIVENVAGLVVSTVRLSTQIVRTIGTTVKVVVLSSISIFGTLFKEAFGTVMVMGKGIIQAGKNLIAFSGSWFFTGAVVIVLAGSGAFIIKSINDNVTFEKLVGHQEYVTNMRRMAITS